MNYPRPPFPNQQQPMPGTTEAMQPVPDHGETSYKGCNRLRDKKAVITGGDSGIGRAVAIAYAREGADVLISYLNEHKDAQETERLVKEAGRKAVLVPGDLQHPDYCRAVIAKAVSELGGIDILVNNAAHQATFKSIEDISDQEWELTFKVNVHAMFYLTKAAVPHMKPGSSIINTASINADAPNPTLLAYATTKGAIQNFTAGLAQLLADKGIRPERCRLCEAHAYGEIVDLFDLDILVAGDRDRRGLGRSRIFPVEYDIVGRERHAVMPFDAPFQLPDDRAAVFS